MRRSSKCEKLRDNRRRTISDGKSSIEPLALESINSHVNYIWHAVMSQTWKTFINFQFEGEKILECSNKNNNYQLFWTCIYLVRPGKHLSTLRLKGKRKKKFNKIPKNSNTFKWLVLETMQQY